jgi:signal transduction histidine kinase
MKNDIRTNIRFLKGMIKTNMKLKTRIFLSFLIIILVPVILMVGLLVGTAVFNKDYFLNKYGMDIMHPVGYQGAMVANFIFAMVVILIITGVILSIWLYRGIITPINNLTRATRNIRDGNLNFELGTKQGVEEVDELCEAFEEMRARLKEANEEKVEFDRQNRELISNISHDLRTPITAVKGYCEGLIDGVADTPEKQRRYVRTIYNKANEMDHLINELSFYSKITTNRMPYAFDQVDVKSFFDDAADEYRDELQSKNVSFSYSNTVKPGVKIIADVEQIQRVMNNIVGNSLKYMDKDEKKIRLCVQDINDEIQVEITDNGMGIDKKNIARIFDRFYRTDSSRNSSRGGSGIGLSIVKKIIEDHGGRVWAKSKEGEGTSMFFVLRKYVKGEDQA